jgi:hypothetical protein
VSDEGGTSVSVLGERKVEPLDVGVEACKEELGVEGRGFKKSFAAGGVIVNVVVFPKALDFRVRGRGRTGNTEAAYSDEVLGGAFTPKSETIEQVV